MKRAFAVGDRVAVYWASVIGTQQCKRLTVTDIDSFGILTVKDEKGREDYAHPKQCRRLIKKPKRVAREWWINVYRDYVCAYLSKESANGGGGAERLECVHVIEKLPAKKERK